MGLYGIIVLGLRVGYYLYGAQKHTRCPLEQFKTLHSEWQITEWELRVEGGRVT